jgi:hypothetical protein
MTTFRIAIGSALSKALLTGLVVTAIFTPQLEARENHAIDRQTEQSVRPGLSRIEGDRWFAAPAHNAFVPVPSNHPDGVCDHGDSPMIC